jgi:glycosyltransferase involved in cell wall biosynthesis
LVIQNNASTDNTPVIAQHYADRDQRIRLFHTDSLLPIMDNWNLALRRMSPESKYCKVLHADDLLFSQCLEMMVALAERHPTAGLVGSYGLSGDRIVCRGLPHEVEFLAGRELARLNLLNRVNVFWSPTSLMIHSDLIRKRHRFYNETILHADVEAGYRSLNESDFGFVHRVLTFIRRHEESVTSVVTASYQRFLVYNLDLLMKFGPVFLSRVEYELHLEGKLRRYYHFLALSLFRIREKAFWRYHFNAMAKIGQPLRYSKLCRATLVELAVHPLKTLAILARSTVEKVRRQRGSGTD